VAPGAVSTEFKVSVPNCCSGNVLGGARGGDVTVGWVGCVCKSSPPYRSEK
jgi:hypothetical protein